jgi:hypothetical protein
VRKKRSIAITFVVARADARGFAPRKTSLANP